MGQIAFDFDRQDPADLTYGAPDSTELSASPPPAATMNDVFERVIADASLTDSRRRDLLSGLNRLASILDRPLTAIPASASAVRAVFPRTRLPELGLKKKSIQTLRSSIAFVLKRYGRGAARHPSPVKLHWNAEWRALIDRIDVAFNRHALSRFAEFCSRHGFSPADVSNETLLDFYNQLLATEVVKAPKNVVRQTISSWNRTSRDISEWPQGRLSMPNKSTPYIFPLAHFPASFQADLDSWERKTASKPKSGSIFRGQGSLRPLRPETIKSQLSLFRQVATALVKSGAMRLDEIQNLASLCHPDKLRQALEFEHERLGGNDRRVIEMANRIRILSKHFAILTPDQAAGLDQLCIVRPEPRRDITERNRSRLAQFDDPGSYDKLVRFPARAAAEARTMKNRYRAAKRMEQAVAISILLNVAPRMATLRQIELSWLKWQSDGSIVLGMPPKALKAGRALEVQLNVDCGEMIRELIRDFRPALPCASGPYLFPGEQGGARSKNAMYEQVTDVGRELGMVINPHLYRHLLQKVCVERDPSSVGDVSRVLAHASVSTTVTFYAESSGRAASKRLDALLSTQRDQKEDR